MELFWYSVLIGMLAVYVVFDGYDFGAGIVHLFFAKKEEDKQLITKSIGPFWDANEVWLIAAGGLSCFLLFRYCMLQLLVVFICL